MIKRSRKCENVHSMSIAILDLHSGIDISSALLTKRGNHPWNASGQQTVMAVSNRSSSGRLVVYHTVILNIIQRLLARPRSDPGPDIYDE